MQKLTDDELKNLLVIANNKRQNINEKRKLVRKEMKLVEETEKLIDVELKRRKRD